MAFPWLHESLGEGGNYASEWSEGATDTQSKSSTLHYTLLARQQVPLAPYNGAYAWYVDLAPGANDCFVQENTTFDLAANGTWGLAFAFWADSLTMAANDRFAIFRAQNSTSQFEINIRNTAAAGIEILGCQTGANATVRACFLEQKKWHWVEAWGTVDSGAGNDGTINFALDGQQVSTALSSLNQAPVTDAELGVMDQDVGTTAGHLYFGPLIFDDAQVGFFYPRYPRQSTITKSRHLFVGPGSVAAGAILSAGADDSVILYDTDTGYSTAAQYQVAELSNKGMASVDGPLVFTRGCYAALSGTNARAQVMICRGDEGIHHPLVEAMCITDANVKSYALSRKRRPGNI